MSQFVDLTGRHVGAAYGSPAVVSVKGVWGPSSTRFDGSGDYLTVAGGIDDLWFAAGDDFSIEVGVRLTRLGCAVWDYYNSHQLFVSGSGALEIWTNGAFRGGSLAGAVAVNVPAWLEWSRSAGVSRLFVNGLQVAMWPDTTVYRYSAGPVGYMTVGGFRYPGGYPGHDVQGWLSHFRMTRSARHVSDYVASVPVAGAADPLWGATVLFLLLSIPPIDSLHSDLLRRLLPPVSIDRKGSMVSAECDAFGLALDAAAIAADGVLAESDPRTTMALLADWERNYGLEPSGSIDVRRAALLAQILAGGGQSRAFYVQLAAALGYTTTITEFSPHTVISSVAEPLRGGLWRYIWLVRAHASAGAVTPAAFEALFNKIKPAHTRVMFEYY